MTPQPIHPDSASADEGFLGLYIHVPFCFHKCHYCDFYSIVDSDDRHSSFVDRVVNELRYWAVQAPLRPRTIFVGGGTPTLLPIAEWRRLLEVMHDLGVLQKIDEFTVEANPETVTFELLACLKDGGVNRMSIGAQSFDPSLLATLERWHEPASVLRAVRTVRQSGIENFNLDLIFAIPGQSTAQLDRDLDEALALRPTHLSFYSLIFEPGTPLHQQRRRGKIQPVDDDLERAFYERVMARLSTAGYEHYEISNWAHPGHRCAHNLLYWHNHSWLGLGPSAASHRKGRRWKNTAHLGMYLKTTGPAPICEDETLPTDQSIGEQLMLRLRLTEGVQQSWIDANVPIGSARRIELDRLVGANLLTCADSHVRLTYEGRFLADSVLAALL